MSAAVYESSLETGTAGTPGAITPDPSILGDTIGFIPQTAPRSRLFRRPNWLSPEIWAFVVGGMDFCLVPAAAAPPAL